MASSLGLATTAETFLPPPKKIHGVANGVSGVLQGCPQEQGALTGQAWKLRLLRGMTRLESAAAGGLEGAADGGVDFPANGRLEGAADGGLAALAGIPQNSYALSAGYGGITSGDFLATGQTKTGTIQKTFKKRTKQNEVKGRRLLFRSGLLSRCTVFNKSKQGRADTQERVEQTKKELNRQELNTQGN